MQKVWFHIMYMVLPRVSEVSNYAIANGTSSYGGGSYTFNVNGQAIEVVKNSTGINNQ